MHTVSFYTVLFFTMLYFVHHKLYVIYYASYTILYYTILHYIEGKEDEWKTVTLARLIAANGFIRAENIQVYLYNIRIL